MNKTEYVYVKISGAIYGLAQSGYLANQNLIKNLVLFGYYPSRRTPGLWHHKTQPIKFSLVVDIFCIKYVNKDDAQHLIESIKAKDSAKADWARAKYIGIDLHWNYEKEEVELSMKVYVPKVFKELKHPLSTKPVNGPTPYIAPVYVKSVHYAQLEEKGIFTDKQI